MKIALVSLRFDAPGGVETNVREVARGLQAGGDEVRVFASDLYDEDRWERRSDFPPEVDGIPVARFPVFRRLVPGLSMPLCPGLMPALSASGADIIHAHSHRYGHVLQAAAVSRRRGIPFVVSTHYHPADRRESAMKRGLLRCQDVLFGMAAYRRADAIVVETELEGRLVAQFARPERIRVIPPGVDLEGWRSDPPTAPPPNLPKEFLLFAGRVASNKGLPVLVEALARIPESERLPLVIMGPDWGERARLEALAERLGVRAWVQFLGHVPGAARHREVFRRARLFVLPSEWEAFGLVLLESMAAGVPVIASAVGGVPEVLEDGKDGVLVPYGDVDALAREIRSLLKDEGRRRQLSAAGTARVRELTWARCVERHRALYREIVA
jgi:glycosyltransferase involved in cell wall biosynthesis